MSEYWFQNGPHIVWAESVVSDGIIDPPSYLFFKGEKYEYTRQCRRMVGGPECGEVYHLVKKDGVKLWVTEVSGKIYKSLPKEGFFSSEPGEEIVL